jgi:hypothetical protein
VQRICYCFLVLSASIFSGCATIDRDAIQSKTTGKSILVASNIQPSLTLLWIGTTVFNNEHGEYVSPDLRLNEVVRDIANSVLFSEKRYHQVEVIERLDRASEGFLHNLKGKADFLILIENGTSPDIIFKTNQSITGVGVLQRSMFGNKPRTLVYAALKAEMFDLRNAESLGTKTHLEFMDTATPLDPGPTIPARALEQIKDSATTRTQGAVLILLRAFGLR